MKQKVLLTREDGYEKIFLKIFDKDDKPSEEEFEITYEEWDESKKERLDKNIYILELGDEEQQKRIEWLMEPVRMITILTALNPERIKINSMDLSFMFRFGSITTEYQEKFKKSLLDFVREAKLAKEVFQIMLTKTPEEIK